ncbi:MAG TPA: hypothetical protein VMI06_16235 [Terriglobia bacterium]|nr:hypothetical protein [Terriglobia bacterium]
MESDTEQRVAEAFNSMLRTDYISLDDVEKLKLFAHYYVDYFGYLPQILAESDQLIVGRRGTGKTTLLYRAFVECMRSWQPSGSTTYTKPRTLGIYIDLSKCASLDPSQDGTIADFEHVFVTELCECVTQQLKRYWPSVAEQGTLLDRIFHAAEQKQAKTGRKPRFHLSSFTSMNFRRYLLRFRRGSRLFARQVADDVGCYVQKVAKFGEKLDREGVIQRSKEDAKERYIYFGKV